MIKKYKEILIQTIRAPLYQNMEQHLMICHH